MNHSIMKIFISMELLGLNPIDFQEGRWAFENDFNENPIEIPNVMYYS